MRLDLGPKTPRAIKLYRWWYISIGVGFALLGFRALIAGERPVNVALRFIIAVGFVVLGVMFFKPPRS